MDRALSWFVRGWVAIAITMSDTRPHSALGAGGAGSVHDPRAK
jgi:hypothetical protein